MKDVKVKNVKKLTVGIPAIIALLIIFAGAYALLGQLRSVSATGVCVAKVPRDKFAITLQIKTLHGNAAGSLRAVQNNAEHIAQRVRLIDDNTLEIQTKNIFSYEKTEWKNNSSVVLGIESQIDLEITTSGRETIDAVLEIAKDVKTAQVFPQNMRNFSSRETTDKATAECLQTAIKDARDKAASLAAGDGERLGRLVSAHFGTARSPDVQPIMLRAAMSEANAAGDYIQSAEGDLSIKVDATFRIR